VKRQDQISKFSKLTKFMRKTENALTGRHEGMKKAGKAAMELRGQLRSQMEFGIEGLL
jgi:hypothetical protein